MLYDFCLNTNKKLFLCQLIYDKRMNLGRIFILTMTVVFLMKPFVPMFFYLANVDYIKEYFCVNKDKPMLHCDGTCFLAKKMAEAKKKEQSDRLPVDQAMVQIDWIQTVKLNFLNPVVQACTRIAYIPVYYHKIYLGNPFRPPQAA